MFSIAIPLGISKNPFLLNDPWLYVAILTGAFFALYALWGLHISITDSKISRVDFFFWKDTIEIKNIESIVYHPSFVFGGPNKTVSVLDAHGNKVFMESMPFGKEKQRALIASLIRLNPSIRLNEDAEALLKRYAETN